MDTLATVAVFVLLALELAVIAGGIIWLIRRHIRIGANERAATSERLATHDAAIDNHARRIAQLAEGIGALNVMIAAGHVPAHMRNGVN